MIEYVAIGSKTGHITIEVGGSIIAKDSIRHQIPRSSTERHKD